VEIVRDEVIVSLFGDGVDEGVEDVWVVAAVAFVTGWGVEFAGEDGGEDFGEVWVDGFLGGGVAVEVFVAEVFDVFGEVSEEKDVLFADFAGYFDLMES
jgi:hypothetical protein